MKNLIKYTLIIGSIIASTALFNSTAYGLMAPQDSAIYICPDNLGVSQPDTNSYPKSSEVTLAAWQGKSNLIQDNCPDPNSIPQEFLVAGAIMLFVIIGTIATIAIVLWEKKRQQRQ